MNVIRDNMLALYLASIAVFATKAEAEEVKVATAQADADSKLDEIVVTAQKRDQNLQKVPISVSVLGGESLESRSLKSIEDLSSATPGLQIGNGAGTILPFLRGVGNNSTAAGNEASVATYIDGVYFSVLPVGFFTFEDLERVEVLKGPQGTLFGRNSSGGVLNLITKDPSHELGGKASLGYGNYDTVEGDLYVTGGLSDNLSANLSVAGRNQGDGFGRNVTTSKKNDYTNYFNAHSKIMWEPSDNLKITLSPFYSYSVGSLTSSTYPGTVAGYVSPPFNRKPTLSFYDSSGDYGNLAVNKAWGGSLKIKRDFSFATFLSITAYNRFHSSQAYDADVSERPDYFVAFADTIKQTTQEFQLSSKSRGPVEWTLGLFYYHADNYLPALLGGPYGPFGPQGGMLYGQQKANSLSGYAQATYEILPKLNLTGGLRYSADKAEASGRIDLLTTPITSIELGSGSFATKKLTYRGSLDYSFSPSALAYATVSRGYKAGLFNVIPFDGSHSAPEVLDNYEAGLKLDLFDRRVRFNASAFYYSIKNPQVQILGGVGGTPVYSNAKKAEVRGAEFDSQFVIAEGLKGRLSATWLDSKYKSYTNAPSGPPIFTTPYGATTPFAVVDASGNYTVQAPKLTLNAGFDYAVETNAGRIFFTADYFYNDGFFWEADNILRQKSYHLLSAQLGFAPTDHLTIRISGKNLLNERYTARTGSTAGATGYPMVAAPPRTYGLSIGVDF